MQLSQLATTFYLHKQYQGDAAPDAILLPPVPDPFLQGLATKGERHKPPSLPRTKSPEGSRRKLQEQDRDKSGKQGKLSEIEQKCNSLHMEVKALFIMIQDV